MNREALEKLADSIAKTIRPTLRKFGETVSLPCGIVGLQFNLQPQDLEFHVLFAEFVGEVQVPPESPLRQATSHEYVKAPTNTFSHALLLPEDLGLPATLDEGMVQLEYRDVSVPLTTLFGPREVWPKPIRLWRCWLKPEHSMLYYVPKAQDDQSRIGAAWVNASNATWMLAHILRAALRLRAVTGSVPHDPFGTLAASLPLPSAWEIDDEREIAELEKMRQHAGASNYVFELDVDAQYRITCRALRPGATPVQLLVLNPLITEGATVLGDAFKKHKDGHVLIVGSTTKYFHKQAVLLFVVTSHLACGAKKIETIPGAKLHAAMFPEEQSHAMKGDLVDRVRQRVNHADAWLRGTLYGGSPKGPKAFIAKERQDYRLCNTVCSTPAFNRLVPPKPTGVLAADRKALDAWIKSLKRPEKLLVRFLDECNLGAPRTGMREYDESTE